MSLQSSHVELLNGIESVYATALAPKWQMLTLHPFLLLPSSAHLAFIHVSQCPLLLSLSIFHSLTPADQCKALVENAHIYLTGNGRISMAGLNSNNVEYVAQSIDKAVRGQL